jgi:hypothetical protein
MITNYDVNTNVLVLLLLTRETLPSNMVVNCTISLTMKSLYRLLNTKKHNYIPYIVHLYKIMLKNCPSKTHESPSKQNIVTVRKIHMVNKFTVSRVKALQVKKENDKILLIAIGNVLKNKYIHIVNNIACVFHVSIIMQIFSLYIIIDKQKDVSHDVIMVKCYKFCYYLYIHVHRGIFLLTILPNFHNYAYYYKLQANIR